MFIQISNFNDDEGNSGNSLFWYDDIVSTLFSRDVDIFLTALITKFYFWEIWFLKTFYTLTVLKNILDCATPLKCSEELTRT